MQINYYSTYIVIDAQGKAFTAQTWGTAMYKTEIGQDKTASSC